jgi:hypothetical protein
MAKGNKTNSFSARALEKDLYSSNGYSAPVIAVLERRVRFSLKHCNTGDYCISKITSGNEASKLNARLGYFEDLEWGQVVKIPRQKGISIEKRDSSNYKYLKKMFPEFTTFGHFRVTGLENAFRVFGTQVQELFYILLIDREGRVNHK